MKIAIVHDWLSVYGGAERVLEQMLRVFPEADLHSLIDFMPPGQRAFLAGRPVKTSFIQSLPFARTKYRSYLPLMPLAIEQFDLSAYDLVISSSYAVAKGVITGPDQLHLSYVFSPARYAWDLQQQYLEQSGLDRGVKGWLVRYILHRFRIWDLGTANGVDAFATSSAYIARQIWKIYRREATIIPPPVDIEHFTPSETKDDFYLTASRLVPYKRVDLIVDAFRAMPDRELVVIGDGPDYAAIKARAPANVTMLGHQPGDVLRDHMRRARAFVFAAEEDFGIVPIEAQACGTPVIAYGKGGVLETIDGLDTPHPTGLFFDAQTTGSLIDAVKRFEASHDIFTAHWCRERAVEFTPARFRREFAAFVQNETQAWERRRAAPVAKAAEDAA